MPSLNQTIDRSLQISRSVAQRVRAPDARRSEAYVEPRPRSAQRVRAGELAPARAAIRSRRGRTGCEYGVDFAQRSVLFLDTLRQRGNNWIAHEAGRQAAGARVQVRSAGRRPRRLSGRSTTRWCGSFRRRASTSTTRMRPYIIIDPRAGHGPGIGGFKEDSEVGVALSAGHPVYFVIFYPDPEPGPDARRRHRRRSRVRPHRRRAPSGKREAGARRQLPGRLGGDDARRRAARHRRRARHQRRADVVLGRQRWRQSDALRGRPRSAAPGCRCSRAILAAASSTARISSQNFENLNPANTLWEKYYHLFDDVDDEAPRFLEFERWWGGFYLMNEEEIRWIVNNLFIGNKLSQGEARLGPGRYFDLKSIKQPIIVFASMGDNITPPQQAFNWISDIYSSHRGDQGERPDHRRADPRGRRPPRHLRVGQGREEGAHADRLGAEVHPGSCRPGLYGMQIHETVGADGKVEYDVTLHERKLEDLKRLQKYDRVDEKPFEAVAALSELTERAYELLVRPAVREATPEWLAKVLREWHPLRVQRWWFSDRNPLLWPASRTRRRWRAPTGARARRDNAGRRVENCCSPNTSPRVARPVSRPSRRDERGGVLRGVRQHAVAADGGPARR